MVKKDIARVPILEALRRNDPCPLCALWSRAEKRYLAYTETNEVTMSPSFRKKVVESRGFCNRHMHLLYDVAFSGETEDGLGYAMYARDVLESVRSAIEVQQKPSSGGGSGRRAFMNSGRRGGKETGPTHVITTLRGRRECPICGWLTESDKENVSLLLRMLQDDADFVKEFEGSAGICVPHLVSALELAARSGPDGTRAAAVLLEAQRRGVIKLIDLLGERIRKYGHDAREEKISAAEASSQEMAMNMIAGVDGLTSILETLKKG